MNHDLATLRSRLPDGVLLETSAVHDATGEICAEEQAMVATAVDSRRFEFSSARVLAHKILNQLGRNQGPLLSHPDRSPAWPQGVLGSLSHSRTQCAALIAEQKPQLLGLGVDVEDLRPMKPNLFAEILTRAEMECMTSTVPENLHVAHVLTIFGIKEAVYKAMLPLGNQGLGFHAMEVDVLSDPLQPKVRPLADLQQRLPLGCLLQVLHHRQDKILLSVVILQTSTRSTS